MEPDEYDVLADVEGRHWWHVGMRRLCAGLLDSLALPPRARILDAGCGTGGNAELFTRYGRVWGLDVSPLATRWSRARLPGRIVEGSVEALPFAAESFDLVASLEVLYHARVENEARALGEARRVLRSGGTLLLRLPAFPGLLRRHDRRVHTRRRYRKPEVTRMLEDAGFRVVRATYVNSILLPAVAARVLAERAFASPADPGSELKLPGRLMNRLLEIPLAFEASWIRLGGSFPAGLSILCIGQKNA